MEKSEGVFHWDFGDKSTAVGVSVDHTYKGPGIYQVLLSYISENGSCLQSSVIVRVYPHGIQAGPQVIIDTDARNEIDNQHCIAYALFSGIDVLAVNSNHNGDDFSEEVNFGEIYFVLRKLRNSGIAGTPLVFRGAPHALERPGSGVWTDTEPVETAASKAIIAAARGASPENPVYFLPVGPCTNIASAILQAREQDFDLTERIRVIWIGGGPENVNEETYNGKNDPWSVFVVGQSGVDFTIMLEHPTSARLSFIRMHDKDRYPDNDIGYYLRSIILERLDRRGNDTKSLYDLTTISTVISKHLGLNWLSEVEAIRIIDVDGRYSWQAVQGTSNVRIIWDIEEEEMKEDFFNTLNGLPAKLVEKD